MPKVIRGMKDILPDEVSRWQKIESASRDVFRLFGYRQIRTPALEETALFVKSIGGETDIVQKEMFSFRDRGERDVSLRPEGTAPIVRAYLEASLHKTSPFQKLYYLGAMFRAERPQAGRMRQFHQIGAEAIGSPDPAIDAEIIALEARILDSCGIKDYILRINNLGCKDDKKRLSRTLKDALTDKKAMLCDDCKRRLAINPLRVIDCKKDNCRDALRGTLKNIKFLCEGCIGHFDSVKALLDILRIKYLLDPYIVRGLDYYTRTVFEVSHSRLARGQDAVGAGGRYDNLISDMGGPELGACGFALGIERMIMAMGEGASDFGGGEAYITAYIAAVGEAAHKRGFGILNDLRSAGIACDMDYEAKSLKAQMRSADKSKARFAIIIGDEELASGEAVVRNMATKEQRRVKLEDIVSSIGTPCHD